MGWAEFRQAAAVRKIRKTQIWHFHGGQGHTGSSPLLITSLLWDWPHLPPTLSNTHTFSLSPPPQVDSWLPPSFLKRIESWEEMLSSLQYFPSQGQFRALESSMGAWHWGRGSIHQCASFFSSDTCIESFHRQHQGWDNGWDPWADTGAPNSVMRKLPKGTRWGKREFTGWNSLQGDYSVRLQHFNKSFFLGGKKESSEEHACKKLSWNGVSWAFFCWERWCVCAYLEAEL